MAIPVLVITSIVIFALMRILPGDPILVLAGEAQAEMSPETLQQLRRAYGLDRPLYIQYLMWISDIATGNFGRSVRTHQPVLELIAGRLLPTIQIGFVAWVLAMALAIPAAVVSATNPNSGKDWVATIGALFGAAMPYFLLGGILIYVVSLRLKWLPASGYISIVENPLGSLRSCILPAVTLGLGLAAVITRQLRSSLIEVLHQPYIMVARAKGLRERQVLVRHAFKNAMLPVTTILGIQLGYLFGGAVITETIFAIPGMGRLLVEAIFSRDYPIVQAVVLLISVAVVLANLAVDIVYAYLDPRIRY